MVSTTFTRETQLSIDLPEAEGKVKETHEKQIEILIDETGNYRVNGQGLVDTRMRTLQAAIYKISAGDTTMPMILTADAQAAHQDVVRAMDAAGQMGFRSPEYYHQAARRVGFGWLIPTPHSANGPATQV